VILEPSEHITARGLELLLSTLSPDEAEAADAYDLLRRKTLRFFQWKGSADADELTDLTLLRVGRKLGEGAPVGRAEIGAYVRGVARMVYLESLRSDERDRKIRELAPAPEHGEADGERERQLRCLDEGLASLDDEERTLILGYYADDGSAKIALRKRMAETRGVSMTALRIRAHRLRERLSTMVLRCIECG
jgi:DNA-directed RNA polymerase specialized sigma24 family protein